LTCSSMETGSTIGTDLPTVGLSLLRLIGALALVLAVFFGGVWLFRNWQRLLTGRQPRPRLRLVEARHLGGRQAIYVVAYDQQRFLLGSSPAGLTLLTRLPDDEPQTEAAPGRGSSFAEALQQAVGQT